MEEQAKVGKFVPYYLEEHAKVDKFVPSYCHENQKRSTYDTIIDHRLYPLALVSICWWA